MKDTSERKELSCISSQWRRTPPRTRGACPKNLVEYLPQAAQTRAVPDAQCLMLQRMECFMLTEC
jgi:hypothetical protein